MKAYKNQSVRASSIELLRIIMVMGVIILHYNNRTFGGAFEYVEEGSINQLFLFLSENVSVYAVNTFVMISGYFLCTTDKRNSAKVAELLIQVIFFNYLSYALGCIQGDVLISARGIMGCVFPINYYVILYVTLYLISPYINILLHNLSDARFHKFVVMIFGLFSVYTILVDYIEKLSGLSMNGLSTIGLYGSSEGYTIVNFVLVYIIGAYIRMSSKKYCKKKLLIAIAVLIMMMLFITAAEYKSGLGYGTVWNYNNPLIIMCSACVLMLFTQLEIYSRIINELAKAVFTCFLFHGMVLKFYGIEEVVNRPLQLLVLHQLLTVTTIYLMSYVLYKLYDLVSRPLVKAIEPLCRRVDFRWN